MKNINRDYGRELESAAEEVGFEILETEHDYKIFRPWQNKEGSCYYFSKCAEPEDFDKTLKSAIKYHKRKTEEENNNA